MIAEKSAAKEPKNGNVAERFIGMIFRVSINYRSVINFHYKVFHMKYRSVRFCTASLSLEDFNILLKIFRMTLTFSNNITKSICSVSQNIVESFLYNIFDCSRLSSF